MDLFLPGPVGRLQAVLWRPAGEPRAAAVVCHPHPLHGGTLETTAVFRTARALQQAGLAVLRFNFRGVGQSEGVHDGRGAEEEDLVAALDWMEERFPGLELWAGGFSFGSRTAALLALREPRIARVVLVTLPVRAFDLAAVSGLRVPGLVVTAEHDEFGNAAELRERIPDLPETLEVTEVAGADHYFSGRSQELQARVRAWAGRALGVPS